MQIGFGVIAFAVAALSSTNVGARVAAGTDHDRKIGPADRRFNTPAGEGRKPALAGSH
jgi:hypothetical protein